MATSNLNEDKHHRRPGPQIKVCGLTRADEAAACAKLGVHAIGCVFYPKSPRHVTPGRAKAIVRSLPAGVTPVGVFVNESISAIADTVDRSGIQAVQLHGDESPDLVEKLATEGLLVIKALFVGRAPHIEQASEFFARAFLVECGKGMLPGGNALTWNWEIARPAAERYPLILAGGLTPENVGDAVHAALPDAVDVSSGVESAPGRKDLKKVASFINAVRKARTAPGSEKKQMRRIFQCRKPSI